MLPVAEGVLTPFSYSVVAEVTSRAWFQYYDRLGFDPMPRARIVRQYNGRAYFNQTLSAQREAELASIDPVTYQLDGVPFPVTKVEKGGFLAGLKAGRNERKLEQFVEAMLRDSEGSDGRARQWYEKTGDLRWTQAEILQVMEEIEPAAVEPLLWFVAVRQAILLHLNRLMRMAAQPPTVTLEQIDQALSGTAGVLEAEIATRLAAMASGLSPSQRALLAEAKGEAAQAALAQAGPTKELESFLKEFGHRSHTVAEAAEPRWSESTEILAQLIAMPPVSPAIGNAKSIDSLLSATDSRDRKAAQDHIAALGKLLPLQSRALQALSYVVAGARLWALAAGREAMTDSRLLQLDDVFFYELEEIKEMMTGEWNISDRAAIQATAAKRRAQHVEWCMAAAPDLLIGETPAQSRDLLADSTTLDPSVYYVVSATGASGTAGLSQVTAHGEVS